MFNMFSFSRSPRNQLANHGQKARRKFSNKLQTKQDQSAAVTAAEDFKLGVSVPGYCSLPTNRDRGD